MAEVVLDELVRRTNGDVYIGVVGPVRVGKSVLVKKLMEMLVIPMMQDAELVAKTIDELPQSSPGPVIMTSEPKFVPAQAIPIQTEQLEVPFRIRFADCVGYVVEGAQGYEHEGKAKLVHTPWSPDPIPFIDAAKIGTDKVIRDHATIGILVTTDGTINGFTRSAVESVEKEIIAELEDINKPYIILINSVVPNSEKTKQLKQQLIERYHVPVLAINIEAMTTHHVHEILTEALLEFPIHQLLLNKPDWMEVLGEDHPMNTAIEEVWDQIDMDAYKIREVDVLAENFLQLPFVSHSEIFEVDAGRGTATIQLQLDGDSYLEACKTFTSAPLETKRDWLSYLKEAADAQKTQERFLEAIQDAEKTGYGIAIPTMQQFEPEEPELIKQNDFYGVRMKTIAPSYHIIRVDLEAEFAPLIGSQFHAEHLLNELQRGYISNREELWQISLFGTGLADVLKESMKYKINGVPESAKKRMRQTIERMVNEGERGLITFII